MSYADDEDIKRLLPCPFCGGGITEFHDNGRVWTGMRYSDPVSVSVRHWCAEAPGPSRLIERIGRDKEQAIERWNMRSNAEITHLRAEVEAKQAQIDALMLEYCPNEMTKEQTDNWKAHQQIAQVCSNHPDAPHGFDRTASHSLGRYVCECEGWEPPNATRKGEL